MLPPTSRAKTLSRQPRGSGSYHSARIIDLGLEVGSAGGDVVAMSPPNMILSAKRSHTARFLRAFLNGNGQRARA
jgi:hypothetical protein